MLFDNDPDNDDNKDDDDNHDDDNDDDNNDHVRGLGPQRERRARSKTLNQNGFQLRDAEREDGHHEAR